MNWKIADRRLCFNLIGVIILLGGLGSAFMIYRLAENYLTNVLSYEEGTDPFTRLIRRIPKNIYGT